MYMAKYNVWVGGEHSWNRSYLGEIGFLPLTEAQFQRWVENDDPSIDAMSERLHRDDDDVVDGEDDFPHRYEVEDYCLGFGAYTDQTFGVSKELPDGEEEILWSGSMSELCNVDDEDEEDTSPRYILRSEEPEYKQEGEDYVFQPGIAYHHCFKGGWGSTIELPDDEEFDVRKLCFSITEADGLAEIVTSFSYNGEDYFDDNGSDGKSCEWWLVTDNGWHSL